MKGIDLKDCRIVRFNSVACKNYILNSRSAKQTTSEKAQSVLIMSIYGVK